MSEENKICQRKKIIGHLKLYGSITPWDAINKYGILRLGARILELRNSGYPIDTIMERGKNSRYARYTLTATVES